MRQESSVHFARSQALHGVARAEACHVLIEKLARSSGSCNAMPILFCHQPRRRYNGAALARHWKQLHHLFQPFFIRVIRKDRIPSDLKMLGQLQNNLFIRRALIQTQPSTQRPSEPHILTPHSSSTVPTDELDQHSALGVFGCALQVVYGCYCGARLAYP